MNIKKLEDYDEFITDSYTNFTYKLVQLIEESLSKLEKDQQQIKSEIRNNVKMLAERCYKEGYMDAMKFCSWLHDQIS